MNNKFQEGATLVVLCLQEYLIEHLLIQALVCLFVVVVVVVVAEVVVVVVAVYSFSAAPTVSCASLDWISPEVCLQPASGSFQTLT